MMPKWFRGTACHSVCGWLLQCAPEALGSACALLGSDRLRLGDTCEHGARFDAHRSAPVPPKSYKTAYVL